MEDRDVIAAIVHEAQQLPPMELALSPQRTFSLVGVLQLALRHPEIPPSARETAETFIALAQAYFADCPTVLDVIDRGFDPNHDRR